MVIAALLVVGFHGSAECTTTIYAQDWETQLFDKSNGVELEPATIELIREFAHIYGEGGWRNGAARIWNPSRTWISFSTSA